MNTIIYKIRVRKIQAWIFINITSDFCCLYGLIWIKSFYLTFKFELLNPKRIKIYIYVCNKTTLAHELGRISERT